MRQFAKKSCKYGSLMPLMQTHEYIRNRIKTLVRPTFKSISIKDKYQIKADCH
jgi:hypothetical protein